MKLQVCCTLSFFCWTVCMLQVYCTLIYRFAEEWLRAEKVPLSSDELDWQLSWEFTCIFLNCVCSSDASKWSLVTVIARCISLKRQRLFPLRLMFWIGGLIPFLKLCHQITKHKAWKSKLKRFKARNFRWNTVDHTSFLKTKKSASLLTSQSTLKYCVPWTRTPQLQTFIDLKGFDGFTQFFWSSPIMHSFWNWIKTGAWDTLRIT